MENEEFNKKAQRYLIELDKFINVNLYTEHGKGFHKAMRISKERFNKIFYNK